MRLKSRPAAVIAAAAIAVGGLTGVASAAAHDPGATATVRAQSTTTFSNPVLGQGQDPSVLTYRGRYYYTQYDQAQGVITVRTSTSLRSLASAPQTVIVRGGQGGVPCCELWAPELHHVNGAWYIYFAADTGDNTDHRLWVARADRPTGPFSGAHEIVTPGDRWTIDGTVADVPGQGLFLFWSGWPGATNHVQDIYVARMSDPETVTGGRTLISSPKYAWERHPVVAGVYVNEGPSVLVHGKHVFVTYSGSGCTTPYYALGLLSATTSANLTDASSWTKAERPILQQSKQNGVYSTGGNSFFTSPDGRQVWIAFHATQDPAGNCGLEREVWAQPVRFGAGGQPVIGVPVSPQTAVRLPSGDPGA